MSEKVVDRLQRQMERIDHDIWKLRQGLMNLEDEDAIRVHVKINRLIRKQCRLFKEYNRLDFDEIPKEKKVRFRINK